MQLVLDCDGIFRRLSPDEAREADSRRRALLESISGRVQDSFLGSKPHLGPLSPGCQLCGEGRWSCMFLNTVCNGHCFFCPGGMTAPEAPPYAERIVFHSPDDYAAYVERFGFAGVSFSGGEPFLTPDKLVAHVEAVRARLGSRVYIWAYTNGLAVTPAQLERLAKAGLEEIRFNNVERGYALDRVRLALSVIPRVTIEIPAIPEDLELLKNLLVEARRVGVDHLNLHQLMVLGQNAAALMARDYHFVAGTTPAVVESELCALELMKFAVEEGLDLPINYCSMGFKQRWQARAEDLRGGSLVMRGHETQAETGCIRRLWLQVGAAEANAISAHLSGLGVSNNLWAFTPEEERLYLHPSLAGLLPVGSDDKEWQFSLVYLKTVLGEQEESEFGRNLPDYREEVISPDKTVGIRLFPVTSPIPLTLEEVRQLEGYPPPEALVGYERIATGLQDLRTGR
ncbi:MAG: radical SAM protein [Bradymonadales bacterium]|nr:radical SAM protein [Bradymonadales bacterium]